MATEAHRLCAKVGELVLLRLKIIKSKKGGGGISQRHPRWALCTHIVMSAQIFRPVKIPALHSAAAHKTEPFALLHFLKKKKEKKKKWHQPPFLFPPTHLESTPVTLHLPSFSPLLSLCLFQSVCNGAIIFLSADAPRPESSQMTVCRLKFHNM